MSQAIITYNEEKGLKAGGGNFISEGGAYVCKIIEAKYVKAKTNTSGLEFSFEDIQGQKVNFINVYYAKENGEQVTGGMSILNAMMGLTSVNQMTSSAMKDFYICPELTGKQIGVFLQKTLYTKNDKTDGYKFEIRVPFDFSTGKTLREHVNNEQAKTIDSLIATYKDKDERTAPTANSYSNEQQSQDESYIPGFD